MNIEIARELKANRSGFADNKRTVCCQSFDENAMRQGENIFLYCIQSAFAAGFELPAHAEALWNLLPREPSCQFHYQCRDIPGNPLPPLRGTDKALDGRYGVLGQPNDWPTEQLPLNCPCDEEGGLDVIEHGDPDDTLEVILGVSASGKGHFVGKVVLHCRQAKRSGNRLTRSLRHPLGRWPILGTAAARIAMTPTDISA